jgi:hypothetical protein
MHVMGGKEKRGKLEQTRSDTRLRRLWEYWVGSIPGRVSSDRNLLKSCGRGQSSLNIYYRVTHGRAGRQ